MKNDTSTIHDFYILSFPFSLVAMSLGFLLMVNRALQDRLEAQARHDPMSGAYRRDAFLDLLTHEIRVSQRRGSPLSFLMIDVDNFKAVNDTYGHLVGDNVIVDFAARTTSMLREQDVLGRYGGEEFVALLPQSSIEVAMGIAERIRGGIAEASTQEVPHYTVSIGVACLGAGCPDMMSLLDAADKASYRAKRAGKGRVVLAESGAVPACLGNIHMSA